MPRIIEAAILALAVSLPVRAGDTLRDCAAIGDDAARLACYDRLAARPAPAPQAPAVSAPGASSTASPAPAAVEQFGLDAPRQEKQEVDEIRSRIIGHFEGWEQGTRFTLENGQVWQVTDSASAYLIRENPAVSIHRGWLGGYMMQVEGLNKRARVKRLR